MVLCFRPLPEVLYTKNAFKKWERKDDIFVLNLHTNDAVGMGV